MLFKSFFALLHAGLMVQLKITTGAEFESVTAFDDTAATSMSPASISARISLKPSPLDMPFTTLSQTFDATAGKLELLLIVNRLKPFQC